MHVLALRPGRFNDASWLLVLTSDGDNNSVVDYLAVVKVPPYEVFDEQHPLLIQSKKEDSTFYDSPALVAIFLFWIGQRRPHHRAHRLMK